jgi:uncharacterized protein YhbP (UPF0306 family)
MTLATTDPEGNPHATPVYFVSVDVGQCLGLYYYSDGKSEHSQHLTKNPKAAAAIYPECHGWRDIQGLQLRGEVRIVESGEERDSAWKQYKVKFPFVSALKTVITQNELYVFIPCWVRLVDNSKRFGFKKEWDLT